jgi:hypothetical protein
VPVLTLLALATAATINVPGSEGLSLAAAVDSAQSGDTIVVEPEYNGADEGGILVVVDLTIQGGGNNLPPIGVSNASLELVDATIKRTDAYFTNGGGFSEACPYDTCALYASKATLTLSKVNIAAVSGAGLYAKNSSVEATTLFVNEVDSNHPMHLTNPAVAGTHVFTGLSYEDNGGPVEVDGVAGSLTLSNSTFSAGTTGVLVVETLDSVLGDVVLTENHTEVGSSLSFIGGTHQLNGLEVDDCSADSGGVLSARADAIVVWTGGHANHVSAVRDGGVAHVVGGDVTIKQVQMLDVSAARGGLARLEPGTTLVLRDLTVDQPAAANGGTLSIDTANRVEMRASQICSPGGYGSLFEGNPLQFTARNLVVQNASGQLVAADAAGHIDFQNTTLLGDGVSAGIGGTSSQFNLVNTILARFTKATILGNNPQGSQAYNLYFGNDQDIAGEGGYGDGDVLQDPLFDNHNALSCSSYPFLQLASPAVDAGSPDVKDSDQGPSDIGATAGTDGQYPLNAEDVDTGNVSDDTDERIDPIDTGTRPLFEAQQASGGCSHVPLGAAWLLPLLLVGRRR